MQQLSPQQRIAAYEWAAERIASKEQDPYMCILLGFWLHLNNISFYKSAMSHLEKFFPEFKAMAPIDSDFIFNKDDVESRLFILGSCILMAEEEIGKQGKKK